MHVRARAHTHIEFSDHIRFTHHLKWWRNAFNKCHFVSNSHARNSTSSAITTHTQWTQYCVNKKFTETPPLNGTRVSCNYVVKFNQMIEAIKTKRHWLIQSNNTLENILVNALSYTHRNSNRWNINEANESQHEFIIYLFSFAYVFHLKVWDLSHVRERARDKHHQNDAHKSTYEQTTDKTNKRATDQCE